MASNSSTRLLSDWWVTQQSPFAGAMVPLEGLLCLVVLGSVRVSHGCTTLAAARGATADGSVLAAHSNDGDGDTAFNLLRVPNASWPAHSLRNVSGGSVPQVQQTNAYYTKVRAARRA